MADNANDGNGYIGIPENPEPGKPYMQMIERAAQSGARSTYRGSILTPEISSVQFEHMKEKDVDFDKLYNGTKEERRAEWAKVDAKVLGTRAADLALQRAILPELKQYAGDFVADTEKYRNGELEGDALDSYEAMADLLRGAGYDPQAFVEATRDLRNVRNLSQAVGRNLQAMTNWRSNVAGQKLQQEAQDNYDSWRAPEDQRPTDLVRRLDRMVRVRESELQLEDMV